MFLNKQSTHIHTYYIYIYVYIYICLQIYQENSDHFLREFQSNQKITHVALIPPTSDPSPLLHFQLKPAAIVSTTKGGGKLPHTKARYTWYIVTIYDNILPIKGCIYVAKPYMEPHKLSKRSIFDLSGVQDLPWFQS